MIRVERVSLPDGLRAIAHRDSGGNLIIYVSNSLDAECARAAVRKAMRASRRPGWRAGLPPVGAALLVALRQWLRRAVTALHAGPAVWATASTALVVGGSTAAVFITHVPHQHVSAAPARPPAYSARPRQPRTRPARHRSQAQPAAARPAESGRTPASRPKPGGSSHRPARPSPSPSPAPSPAPSPSAVPSPSPSPSGGSPGGCLTILGIRVCA